MEENQLMAASELLPLLRSSSKGLIVDTKKKLFRSKALDKRKGREKCGFQIRLY
jgi:hypothetical protein